MVTSHNANHLVAWIVCLSFFALHTECASMYDGFDTNLAFNTNQLEKRTQDRLTLDRLAELTGSDIYGSASSSGRSSSPSTRSRSQESSRVSDPLLDEDRYVVGLRLPEDTYINEVLLHPVRHPRPSSSRTQEAQSDLATFDLPLPDQSIRNKNEVDGTSFSLPLEMEDLNEIRVPGSRSDQWQQHQQQQQQASASNLGSVFVKPRPARKWQPVSQKEMMEDVRLPAVKRWWGNTYRQPRGQMARRSQGKHYSCLKTCIQEGKLHPIQCHTLC